MKTDKLIESIIVGDAKPKDFYEWASSYILAGEDSENINILVGVASERNPSNEELIQYFKCSLVDKNIEFPRVSRAEFLENRFKIEFENLIFSITEEELLYIASADYAQDIEKHYAALKYLIFDCKGIYNDDLYWYPYECVELCRWSGEIDHQREFAIANCIIAQSIIVGKDVNNDPAFMLEKLMSKYNELPEELRNLVIEHVSFSARC